MRHFKNNALRDDDNGKIKYYGIRHPLTEWSYGKFMMKHKKMSNGKIREADNWWGGWDEKTSIDSLIRHAEELQAIEAGLYVYRVRIDNGEKTVMSIKPLKALESFRISKDDCYNAIRFNAMAGLLEHLRNIWQQQ